MTFDRSEYDAFTSDSRHERINGRRPNLEFRVQAEVSVDRLVGDPDWDRFLSYIQGAIEGAEKDKARFEAALHDVTSMNHDTMMAAKVGMIRLGERIAAWKSVLDLPREIKEEGSQARDLLLELPAVE